MKDINDLRRERSGAATQMEDCANAIQTLEEADTAADDKEMVDAVAAFAAAEAAFKKADEAVKRAETVERAKAASAQGDEDTQPAPTPQPARATKEADKGIGAGLIFQALAACKGDKDRAVEFLDDGGHSGISAALTGATESAGGITIPQAQATELIDLLRPKVAVRASGARTVDMPAGELRHARLSGSATANYTGENASMPVSEQTFDNVDKEFKKLTALVPVGNSLLRHSSTSLAALVRDDILKVMARREDLAFIRGDGTNDTPTGLRNWTPVANWAAGIANTPAAVEAALRARVSIVEDADVGMTMCGWIMRAATKNFLASLRDPDSGHYIFPSINDNGQLLGYGVKTTSQIPMNLGGGSNETEVYFADFDEVMIGDAMSIQFATSTEASYVDGGATQRNAFQEDKTLFRAISEHDLAPMHDAALSGLNGVNWTL